MTTKETEAQTKRNPLFPHIGTLWSSIKPFFIGGLSGCIATTCI